MNSRHYPFSGHKNLVASEIFFTYPVNSAKTHFIKIILRTCTNAPASIL